MSRGRVRPGRRVDAADFVDVRLSAALTRAQAAQLLRVSVRTLRNWEQGKARVPYSAYALLRIHGGYALPGEAWQGWRIRGDALYSPEGLAFRASDAAWWSLTCAMARQWREMREQGAVAALPTIRPSNLRRRVLRPRHKAARRAPRAVLRLLGQSVPRGVGSANGISSPRIWWRRRMLAALRGRKRPVPSNTGLLSHG